MVAKVVLFVCAQALVIQCIAGQCMGAGWASAPYSGNWAGTTNGYSPSSVFPGGAFSGGAFPITSSSGIPPSGISVQSENAYCGELSICGGLPYLGAVGLQGELPTAGSGAIAYRCGNGEVVMLSEDIGAGYAAGAGVAAPSIGRAGCGCGRAAYY